MDFKDILKAKSMDTKNDDYQEASIMQGGKDLSEKKDDTELFLTGSMSPAADVWRKLSDQHYALLQSAEKEYHEKVISQLAEAGKKAAIAGSELKKTMIQESFGTFKDKKQITEDTIITLEDNSEEMQKKVQEKLFELGYEWFTDSKKIRYDADLKYFILGFENRDKNLLYCYGEDCQECLRNCMETRQQITAEEFLKDF